MELLAIACLSFVIVATVLHLLKHTSEMADSPKQVIDSAEVLDAFGQYKEAKLILERGMQTVPGNDDIRKCLRDLDLREQARTSAKV